MPIIKTAKSSHVKCFICNRNNVRLYQVKRESVIYAYKIHSIYIKFHSRCCGIHIDEMGLIHADQFGIIPTKEKFHKNEIKCFLDSLEIKKLGVFEKFKNMDLVDNEFCLKITGWSKNKFIEFANYIKNINKTNDRTKEQLIALYRFWLRKGVDQDTLAKMFGENTSQQNISLYLFQIRKAIYNNFVPHFLGANKTREFFLNHNNKTTLKLHNLKEDELAIVADGTYCRIEQSANNEFQYKTYSGQKKDNLVKPFILCCTDGYIIDCYGPFQANRNDASIIEYILETDVQIQQILIPNKTIIFLDRGNYFII